MSPGTTSRDTFTCWPASWTLPPSMAVLASDRVLKKRAAHNHLSTRTFSMAFYEKENLRMMKRYRAKDVVALIEAGSAKNKDVIIAYTHFGYKGYPQGTLLESWSSYNDIHRNCAYLASLRNRGYELTTIRKYLEN